MIKNCYMNNLFIDNEFSQLKQVVLGLAYEFGGCPNVLDAYDPKSKQHINNKTFPLEGNIINELNEVVNIFRKYHVDILRPINIPNCNQIFTRDLGFVIGHFFFVSNMIADRKDELKGLTKILNSLVPNSIVNLPDDIHVEGGDIIVCNKYVFIGYSNNDTLSKYQVSRTSHNVLSYLSNLISNKQIIGFELIKSDDDPYNNCLHLDCCFQPLGLGHVILCPEAFKNFNDVELIQGIFGEDYIINISRIEMYDMFSNIFSISNNVIISEKKFTRLNNILTEKGYTVEEVNFSEISKMGGLLRCSTLPLSRTL